MDFYSAHNLIVATFFCLLTSYCNFLQCPLYQLNDSVEVQEARTKLACGQLERALSQQKRLMHYY